MEPEALSRLRSVLAKAGRELNKSATGVGLTPSQASVLAMVRSRGPIGASELVTLEGLNPTMLSRIISRLTADGLVSRHPDPADNRAVVVEATTEGAALADRVRAARTQVLSDCLDRLDPRHVAEIEHALPALEALAGELRRDP